VLGLEKEEKDHTVDNKSVAATLRRRVAFCYWAIAGDVKSALSFGIFEGDLLS